VARVFAAGTLLFENYSASMTYDISGVTYTKMVLSLKWRQSGWRRKLADKGLYILVGAANDRMPIMDDGRPDATPPVPPAPVMQAQYLNGAGGTLSLGADVVILNGGEGFRLYDEADLGYILLWDLNT
jgi:hypothetical protein